MKSADRTRARVLALQALCLFDALGEAFEGELSDFLRDPVNYHDLGWEEYPGPPAVAWARNLASGAWHDRLEIDRMLTQNVPDWAIQRMQPVDRNILRLGLHELRAHPETPFRIVLNEAIELGKRFGGQDSPGFVNGVLDGIRKRLDAARTPPDEAGARSTDETTDSSPAGSVAPPEYR